MILVQTNEMNQPLRNCVNTLRGHKKLFCVQTISSHTNDENTKENQLPRSQEICLVREAGQSLLRTGC